MITSLNYSHKKLRRYILHTFLALLIAVASCLSYAIVTGAETTYPQIVSTGMDVPYSNGDARNISISDDGRYVAFVDSATNLTPDNFGSNPNFPAQCQAIFVKDRIAGTTKLVSRNIHGEILNGCGVFNYKASISGNGRYIFYTTAQATNTGLGSEAPDPGMGEAAWLRQDLTSGTVEYLGPTGYLGNFESDHSGQKFVVDGKLHDLANGTIMEIPNGNITSISDDGNKILYIETGPSNQQTLFIKDLTSNTTTSILQQSYGYLTQSSISGNGAYVYFGLNPGAQYPPAVPQCNQNMNCFFRYDSQTSEIKIIKTILNGHVFYPSGIDNKHISNNGEKVLIFHGSSIDENGQAHSTSVDRTGFLVLNSTTEQGHYTGYAPDWQQPEGLQGNGQSNEPYYAITADGNEMIFASQATNFGTPPNCTVNTEGTISTGQCTDVYATTTAPKPSQPPTPSTLRLSGTGTIQPSLSAGDTLPGLIANGQTNKASFLFTVKNNAQNQIEPLSSLVFNYRSGNALCLIPLLGINCHSTSLISLNISSFSLIGTNSSTGTLQGSGTMIVDGQTSTVPFKIIAVDGARLTPTSADKLEVSIYPSNSDPNSASPLYRINSAPINSGAITIN